MDAYRKIGESLPLVASIDSTFRSNSMVMKVLANVYEDILTFHKRAVCFFRQKGKRYIMLT